MESNIKSDKNKDKHENVLHSENILIQDIENIIEIIKFLIYFGLFK